MTNFNQVIWNLLQGRKVRRMIWKKFNGFLHLEGDTLFYTDDTLTEIYTLTLRNMLREDWEVIEEKKEETLSDERYDRNSGIWHYHEQDVKKYVGLILNDINNFDVEPCCHGIQQRDIITILKKRLGDKLI